MLELVLWSQLSAVVSVGKCFTCFNKKCIWSMRCNIIDRICSGFSTFLIIFTLCTLSTESVILKYATMIVNLSICFLILECFSLHILQLWFYAQINLELLYLPWCYGLDLQYLPKALGMQRVHFWEMTGCWDAVYSLVDSCSEVFWSKTWYKEWGQERRGGSLGTWHGRRVLLSASWPSWCEYLSSPDPLAMPFSLEPANYGLILQNREPKSILLPLIRGCHIFSPVARKWLRHLWIYFII